MMAEEVAEVEVWVSYGKAGAGRRALTSAGNKHRYHQAIHGNDTGHDHGNERLQPSNADARECWQLQGEGIHAPS